jgi:IS4 transposase
MIRLIDATAVPQKGALARQRNHVWRIHSAFQLPAERFGCFGLTDQSGGERLDRIPVETGEIGIADRVHMQPERVAAVLAAGGAVLVRSGWRNACWLTADGQSVDLLAALHRHDDRHDEGGLIDQPIWIGRAAPKASLLAACVWSRSRSRRKPPPRRGPPHGASAGAERWAPDLAGYADRRRLGNPRPAPGQALVTSLTPEAFPTADRLALYRLRWRIELAFKRLKSLVGLKRPPGTDERSAKPYVLAHLLMILRLEPLIDELGGPPRQTARA